MERQKHEVYEVINKVNGMKYIGKHSSKHGILKDDYFGSGRLITRALKKYGRKNFERKVLGEYETEQEALEAEREMIEDVKAYINPNYYNLCEGGQRGCFSEYIPSLYVKTNPFVYNPDAYIKELESDFRATKGNMYFKLKYYIGYLIINGNDYQYIRSRCLFLSKEYFNNTKISAEEVIDSIYAYVINNKDENVADFKPRGADFYIEELDEINSIFSQKEYIFGDITYSKFTMRKCALGFLILYKYLSSKVGEYVCLNNREALILNGLRGVIAKKNIQPILSMLQSVGYIDISENKYRVCSCRDNGELLYHVKLLDENTHLIFDMYNQLKSNARITISECISCGSLIINNKRCLRKKCNFHAKYIKVGIKTITCIDCGREFTVDARASNKRRCNNCQQLKMRSDTKQRVKKYRKKN